MELQENLLINLINARKFAPIQVNQVIIQDPNQTDESSDENFSLMNLFSELFKRSPEPLIFNKQQLKPNQVYLKRTKTTDICSLIKNECVMNRINQNTVKELRSTNDINRIHQIINELEDKDNIRYLIKQLNFIINTPEYEISSQSLASSLAVDLFAGFKLGDEKILKFVIDNAQQLE
ncbi:Hypothetical_protein [Hexamita inflata]|uniref:Hypothetical_protein n=1 Tax=Hexamita inflata TaxID=28002 RepID=A0AA86RF24_9EUKA|nr:Hypothetical protein HINF_LOCUS58704 [Hexamita inflata]